MGIGFTNEKTFAITPLRRDALKILKAGLEAISADQALQASIHLKGNRLCVGKKTYRLDQYRNIYVVGIGKMALDAARTLEKILGSRITDGVVLDVKSGKLKHIRTFVGTHPFPSQKNYRATEHILQLLQGLDSQDLVISIISGGGSALFCRPHQMRCVDLTNITKVLMKKGANIHEMNTVRKHLSEVQGGQLSRLVHPATLISLIFSDVPGDDISMVASGPTVLDTTSVKDARRILKKYQVLELCKMASCDLRETPKDPMYFERVQNELIVNNAVAAKAMTKKAKDLGYRSIIYSTTIDGEARETGALLASLAKPKQALIVAGETTVTISGNGKGGRNQETALGALSTLPGGALFISLNSDGCDHSDVAGACVDDLVKKFVKNAQISPGAFLKENNSYVFFQKTKSFLTTGLTGLNVSDLMLVLQKE